MSNVTNPTVTLPLRCVCASLQGILVLHGTGRRTGRCTCYCDDCQAWGRYLGRADILDARGGTAVVQTTPARIQLTAGLDHLSLGRLGPKGLHRWYADCCRTPVANTMGAARVPFAGLMRQVVDVTDAELDRHFEPSVGIQGRFAPGGVPPGAAPSATFGIIADAARRLLSGWWSGEHQPSPFFGEDGRPVRTARVLSPEERRALG